MKLLIAYDGSDASRAALDDLVGAGLPEDVAATVLTVERVSDDPVVETDTGRSYISHFLPVAEQTLTALDRALAVAAVGEAALRRLHPRWQIRAAARTAVSPADGIIDEIHVNPVDLVVLGSHHRSAFGRIVHGSVAQRVLAEADCSLRIGHTEHTGVHETMRIVAGIDGSDDSLAAVYEIAHRSWPAGTQVSLVNVTNGMYFGTAPGALYDGAWVVGAWVREQSSAIQAFVQEAVLLLESVGLAVHSEAAEGKPAATILEIAEKREADVVFLGAPGHDLLDRILLGSVSSSVVAHSRRAVEIVRIGSSASR